MLQAMWCAQTCFKPCGVLRHASSHVVCSDMLQAMWCAQTCFKPCSSPVLGTVLPTPLRCCAARVCVCRPQTRVHCQELGRLEIADGYASCLAWSPALSSLSPLSSVSTPCGYLAAASSSAHTLIVPFSLSGPPLQAESLGAPLPDGAQSGARRHGVVPLLRSKELCAPFQPPCACVSLAEGGQGDVEGLGMDADGVLGMDADGVVVVGAADGCQVTCVAWCSTTVLVTGLSFLLACTGLPFLLACHRLPSRCAPDRGGRRGHRGHRGHDATPFPSPAALPAQGSAWQCAAMCCANVWQCAATDGKRVQR